jgi:hypothetical protein
VVEGGLEGEAFQFEVDSLLVFDMQGSQEVLARHSQGAPNPEWEGQ